MEFRTEYRAERSEWDISHAHRILSVGSCFADCMGKRLEELAFKVSSNPFGVLFNPLSIVGNLGAFSSISWDDDEVLERENRFFHYQMHSEISATSVEVLKDMILQVRNKTRSFLKEADVLMLTFGTALVYQLKSTGRTVANCHKMPAAWFEKRLLTVDEIVQSTVVLLERIWDENPECNIILTVSPVRHTKDTLSLNMVSKSVLRLACHQISLLYSRRVHYFPAFEIVTDDLRDYRFYKEDLIHPSEQAEEYVWEKFEETFFSDETIGLNKEIKSIRTGLKHHTWDPESEAYKLFLKKLLEKSKKVNAVVPIPRLIQELQVRLKA